MIPTPSEPGRTMPLRTDADLLVVRQAVRQAVLELKFGLVDQTKMVTATSELARNTLKHGGGGEAKLEIVARGVIKGVRVTFTDTGPGIPDIDRAMTDGYTTGGGMGLGLSGSKRLVNEFDIQSAVGQGTTVTITRWK